MVLGADIGNGVRSKVGTGSGSGARANISPGLSIFQGVVREIKLPQLASYSRRMAVYREMMDDHVVSTLFDAISFPLLSTDFYVEDPTNSAKGEKAREFISENINGMPRDGFRHHASEMMDYVMYGWGLSEMVLKKNGEGQLVLYSLIPMGQDTLERWGELDIRGYPTSVYQREPTNGTLNHVEMEKCVHMTYRARKRNPEGNGLLVSLYRPWYFRKNLEVLEAIGAERDIGNLPVAEPDKDATYTNAELDALGEALANLRIDSSGYIIAPRGVKLSAFGSGGKVYDFRSIIRDWTHNMLRRFFADFLASGAEDVGSSVQTKELTGFFSLALRQIQKSMVDSWNEHLVPYILKNNPSFGYTDTDDVPLMPKIRWQVVGRENVQALATTIATLIDSAVIQPGDDIEDRFRRMLDLPDRVEKMSALERLALRRDMSGPKTQAGPGEGPGKKVGEDGGTPNTNTATRGGSGNRSRARGDVEPE